MAPMKSVAIDGTTGRPLTLAQRADKADANRERTILENLRQHVEAVRPGWGNRQRVQKAGVAISGYMDGDDKRAAVVDLLTDLRHWAEANAIDLDQCVQISRNHWAEEVVA